MAIWQNRRVRIWPGNFLYRYSYYMGGLSQVFGSRNLIYSNSGFPESLHHHCLPLIVGEEPGLKIYISVGDGPGYSDAGLEWSDVYVKRTLLSEEVPERFAAKIIPLGPHFETKIWGGVRTLWHALKTYSMCPGCGQEARNHFFNYFKQWYHSLPESAYEPAGSESDYIFYASTLYPTHPQYNHFRATFIRACLATPGVSFEGGLVRKDDFRVEEYRDITLTKYYSRGQWLQNTKKSAVGFWAPGDQGAMTLKLGEYLACGKAIVAVPIRQEMLPAPLVHGEHVHFVDGTLESMKAAIQLLCEDGQYRLTLERNARDYYEKYVAPQQAIKRYVDAAYERTNKDLHP